ncbi:MAG: glycoside hydrolase family 2 sugar binding, partial [Verrucomicrobiales bacterium]|nr:glycoside hydrolase family 2 sugar binding [Verrucomicrobiales bacterium]
MPNPYGYPRPEYPRPERQRGTLEGLDWLNLNGPWQFRFDPERRGEQEHWHQPDDLQWREQIIVPFPWESLSAWGEGDAAGNDNYYSTRVFRNPLEVNRQNHRYAPRYEVGWYRREIKIPDNEHWRGKRVIVTIGAADFFTDGWCNGFHLGHHEGGYLPFEYDITDFLKPGENGVLLGLLILRVEDPMDNKEQPVGKQWRWYTTNSGIWQTVFVEPRNRTHIDRFQLASDLNEAAEHFIVYCADAGDDCTLEIEITPPKEGASISVKCPVQDGIVNRRIPIQPLYPWNPNEPHLYSVILRLSRKGELVDVVRTYFGMRSIGPAPTEDPAAPMALCLNGVARYLRGALHQSYYPEGIYTAGDVQTFKNDIAYAKKVGFNFLRIHIKIDDPLLLYYADSMGILIMADFPNFGEGGDTALGRRRFEEMMRLAIQRDFNHPSIFAWCLFNETWGFGGQVEFVEFISPAPNKAKVTEGNPPPAALSGIKSDVAIANTETVKAKDAAEAATARLKLSNQSSHVWVQKMWELAKKLDTTRLIEDMSVVHWEHLDYYAHGDTDINSWHFYMHDYEKAKEHIQKVVSATYAGS